MTWRRTDLDKYRKDKQKKDISRNRKKTDISEIKCKITHIFLPGELTNSDQDSRLDVNTFRVVLRPVDLSNFGYAQELSTTAFVLNEEPHYILANYGVKGLFDKVVTLRFSPPLLGSTAKISLEGVLNYGANTGEAPREDAVETKAFDLGKALLGLLPF